jgi:hypothetical protein
MTHLLIAKGKQMNNGHMGNFEGCVESILNAFEVELKRISPLESKVTKVMTTFTELYYTKPLHEFFILENITQITGILMTDVALRDFTLSFTDRAGLTLTRDACHLPGFITEVCVSLCNGKTNIKSSHNSLLNENLLAATYIDLDTLQSVLSDNNWLLYIFFVIVNFDRYIDLFN